MLENSPGNNAPLISVIVPVYNNADYLDTCLDSLCRQTLSRIEIICVNDGSTDASLGIMKKRADGDCRIVVLSQDNQGAASARNLGLKHASGEFVFFIDSDDYIPSNTAFERLYEAAKNNNVQIAGGSMCFDRFGEMDYSSMHEDDLDVFNEETVREYVDYQYDYDFTRFIYSLEMLKSNGIEFPLLSQFEDPVFHVHAMLAAGSFATIPDPVYAYRRFDVENKEHVWSEQAACDRLTGMMELLDLSRKKKLSKLHNYVVCQLETETSGVYLRLTANPRVMRMLYQLNSMIDSAMIASEREGFLGTDYNLSILDILCDGYRKYRKLRTTPVANWLARISRLAKKASRS